MDFHNWFPINVFYEEQWSPYWGEASCPIHPCILLFSDPEPRIEQTQTSVWHKLMDKWKSNRALSVLFQNLYNILLFLKTVAKLRLLLQCNWIKNLYHKMTLRGLRNKLIHL